MLRNKKQKQKKKKTKNGMKETRKTGRMTTLKRRHREGAGKKTFRVLIEPKYGLSRFLLLGFSFSSGAMEKNAETWTNGSLSPGTNRNENRCPTTTAHGLAWRNRNKNNVTPLHSSSSFLLLLSLSLWPDVFVSQCTAAILPLCRCTSGKIAAVHTHAAKIRFLPFPRLPRSSISIAAADEEKEGEGERGYDEIASPLFFVFIV